MALITTGVHLRRHRCHHGSGIGPCLLHSPSPLQSTVELMAAVAATAITAGRQTALARAQARERPQPQLARRPRPTRPGDLVAGFFVKALTGMAPLGIITLVNDPLRRLWERGRRTEGQTRRRTLRNRAPRLRLRFRLPPIPCTSLRYSSRTLLQRQALNSSGKLFISSGPTPPTRDPSTTGTARCLFARARIFLLAPAGIPLSRPHRRSERIPIAATATGTAVTATVETATTAIATAIATETEMVTVA